MKSDLESATALGLHTMMEEHGCRIPELIWRQLQQFVRLPFNELLIFRTNKRTGKREFLLTLRPPDDPFWANQWHVPGGNWKPWRYASGQRTPISQQQACAEVAWNELRAYINFRGEIGTFHWTDLPYGWNISHLCLCEISEVNEEFQTSPTCNWFPLGELPSPMVRNHEGWLWRANAYLVAVETLTELERFPVKGALDLHLASIKAGFLNK